MKYKNYDELTEDEYKKNVFENISVLKRKIVNLEQELETTKNYSLYSLIILIIFLGLMIYSYFYTQSIINDVENIYQDYIKNLNNLSPRYR